MRPQSTSPTEQNRKRISESEEVSTHDISGVDSAGLSPPAKKCRGNLPKDSVKILKDWLYEHQNKPYPSEEEKVTLTSMTKLTSVQVSNWFINARRRILPSMRNMEGQDHRMYIISQRALSSPDLPAQREHAALPGVFLPQPNVLVSPPKIVSILYPAALRGQLVAPVPKIAKANSSIPVVGQNYMGCPDLAVMAQNYMACPGYLPVVPQTDMGCPDFLPSTSASLSTTPSVGFTSPILTSSPNPHTTLFPDALPDSLFSNNRPLYPVSNKLLILAIVASWFLEELLVEEEAKATADINSTVPKDASLPN